MSTARPPPHPGLDDLESDYAVPSLADASSVAASVSVSLIQAVVFVYDFFTYPIYYAVQQPWKNVSCFRYVNLKFIYGTLDEK